MRATSFSRVSGDALDAEWRTERKLDHRSGCLAPCSAKSPSTGLGSADVLSGHRVHGPVVSRAPLGRLVVPLV